MTEIYFVYLLQSCIPYQIYVILQLYIQSLVEPVGRFFLHRENSISDLVKNLTSTKLLQVDSIAGCGHVAVDVRGALPWIWAGVVLGDGTAQLLQLLVD